MANLHYLFSQFNYLAVPFVAEVFEVLTFQDCYFVLQQENILDSGDGVLLLVFYQILLIYLVQVLLVQLITLEMIQVSNLVVDPAVIQLEMFVVGKIG